MPSFSIFGYWSVCLKVAAASLAKPSTEKQSTRLEVISYSCKISRRPKSSAASTPTGVPSGKMYKPLSGASGNKFFSPPSSSMEHIMPLERTPLNFPAWISTPSLGLLPSWATLTLPPSKTTGTTSPCFIF